MDYAVALSHLVKAGALPAAPQIVYIRVGGGASMQEVKAIVQEAANLARPDATVIH